MRTKTFNRLLFLLVLLVNSSHAQNGKDSIKEKCIIIPTKGLNSILINQSIFTDVFKEFGLAKTHKYREKHIELFSTAGGIVKYVEYIDKGIYLSNYTTYTRNRGDTIRRITLNEKCRCRTEKGIGIGSTFKDVIKAYGKPVSNYYTGNSGTEVMYKSIKYTLMGQDSSSRVFQIELYRLNGEF